MKNIKDQTEFVWLATESAPANYPMQIMRGSSFIYHGSKTDGLAIPSGRTLYRGWGSAISSHPVGKSLRPLPDKLEITFFSYWDDALYSGRFDLPYDKILSLFREGVARDKKNPIYRYLMVGVAPGGTLAVWVTGKQSTVEVFFGKAQEKNIEWLEPVHYPEAKRASFVQYEIAESVKPDIILAIRKNGVPYNQWAQYRTQYDWMPIFLGRGQPKATDVIYFNGERTSLLILPSDNKTKQKHPVPRRFAFHLKMPGQMEKKLYIINFFETEILSVFATLCIHQAQLRLEISPGLLRSDTKIRLYNDTESIDLTKWKLDIW